MNHHLDTFGQTCFLSYEFSVLTDQLKWYRLEKLAIGKPSNIDR